jgi:hypothetical protein
MDIEGGDDDKDTPELPGTNDAAADRHERRGRPRVPGTARLPELN